MKTVMFYVGGLLLVAVPSLLAAVVSRLIARKKNLQIPGTAALFVLFVFSVLVGWGASWLCAFLVRDSSLTPFARFTATSVTWYLTGIMVTLIAATLIGKSASGKVLTIAFPWICCFTLFIGILSMPMGRSLHGFEDRVRCMDHLRQVYIGLTFYAEEHGGKLPSRTDEILEPCLAGRKEILSCPNAKTTNSYGYDSTCALGSSGILMWDHLGNHKGGRNILFCNGKVEWLSDEQFKSVAGDARDR